MTEASWPCFGNKQNHCSHASCPGLEFLLAAHVPVNSCTVPRRHGRTNRQPAVLSSTVARIIDARAQWSRTTVALKPASFEAMGSVFCSTKRTSIIGSLSLEASVRWRRWATVIRESVKDQSSSRAGHAHGKSANTAVETSISTNFGSCPHTFLKRSWASSGLRGRWM